MAFWSTTKVLFYYLTNKTLKNASNRRRNGTYYQPNYFLTSKTFKITSKMKFQWWNIYFFRLKKGIFEIKSVNNFTLGNITWKHSLETRFYLANHYQLRNFIILQFGNIIFPSKYRCYQIHSDVSKTNAMFPSPKRCLQVKNDDS